MKLFVTNPNNQKVYLNLIASTRGELQNLIGGHLFNLGNFTYNINQVYAEKDVNKTTAGLIVGGSIGALGGPVGILIGGALGGIIGNTSDDIETGKVKTFNNS